MEESPLLYRVEEGVAEFIINREKQRNSLNIEVIRLFLENLDRAEGDSSVKAVLITGAGDRAFCSGAELGDAMSDKGREAFNGYADLLKRLASFPKPTVARVKGFCLAGGMGFMLACDIVIASDDSRFGTPEVNVGLWPMMIGAFIFRNVLRKSAMEMVLLGERLDAARALDMGLVTRVVPGTELDSEVRAVMKKLASKSPIGMKIGKEAFHAMSDMPLEEALDYLSGRLADVASTEDAREGIRAFLEKREPEFRGE